MPWCRCWTVGGPHLPERLASGVFVAMHKEGHRGIVLLALAPVVDIFLRASRPLLALLACGVLLTERIPDTDQQIPDIRHRGTSHSLFAAFLVGRACAGLGWGLGTYVTVPLADWLSSAGITALGLVTVRLVALDPPTLAAVGWCVGAGGIVLHLAGDIITIDGLQPLLPFWKHQVSLSPLPANSPGANRLLYVLGWLAIVLVVVGLLPIGSPFGAGLKGLFG